MSLKVYYLCPTRFYIFKVYTYSNYTNTQVCNNHTDLITHERLFITLMSSYPSHLERTPYRSLTTETYGTILFFVTSKNSSPHWTVSHRTVTYDDRRHTS